MGSIGVKHTHQDDVVVLMVPFPLQGHLNQLLHLSRLVSARGVPVHYVGTTTHSRQARRRLHGRDPLSNTIVFHEFPSLSFHAPPPDAAARIKFPSHLQPLFEASVEALRLPVFQLMRRLSATSRRVVIVYDSLMGSVIQDFAELPNAESYTFHSISAYAIFFFLWERTGRPFPVDGGFLERLPPLEGCFTAEFLRFVGDQHGFLGSNSGRIYNSCRVVEGLFLEMLENPMISGGKKQWALGPFNPVNSGGENSSADVRHECLTWLDGQGPDSVVLVSFGTTTTFSDAQIREIAAGLERSGQKFIWVLREADCGCEAVHGGAKEFGFLREFEERLRNRGMVVRDWAPQLEILGHRSTGGFMSHCGWNSCMESISMGVPIAAWPMHSDQPRNSALVAEMLRVGVVVREWARREEVVEAAAVERAIRRLMVEEDGAEMRRRAAELGGAVRKAVAEGGVARLEMDSFVEHITR